ncbi:hypothetical protein GF336_00400 [Candidatus Woesearchaeota archaeon]|nr:hypothetical protein [Candidatus Woesearchaeota archaeon]
METRERYEGLRKEHNLPKFEEMNKDFEIIDTEESFFILREIRRKIVERIQLYSKVLESILHPETGLSDLYECKLFTEEEKDRIYTLYKNMMVLEKGSLETSIDETDKKTSEYINLVFKEWDGIKKELFWITKKLKKGWEKEEILKEDVGYLG